MKGYVGEFPIVVENTPIEWALDLIRRYGGIDGDHHKAWVLDQVARVLNGAPVTTVEARWENDEGEVVNRELRYTVGMSEAYEEYVRDACNGEDGPNTYEWDEGIPP